MAEIDAAPITDKLSYQASFGNRSFPMSRIGSAHHNKARTVILRELLPKPGQDVSLDDVLRFKARHGTLLPALRAKIEAHCAQIACLPRAEDRLIATEDFLRNCKLDIDEIVDAMKPTWPKIAFGSLTPLFGAGLAMHGTGLGDPWQYAGAALSLAGCAYTAIASIRDPRIQVTPKPLAYVVHARGQFGAPVLARRKQARTLRTR